MGKGSSSPRASATSKSAWGEPAGGAGEGEGGEGWGRKVCAGSLLRAGGSSGVLLPGQLLATPTESRGCKGGAGGAAGMPLPPDRARGCQAPSPRQKLAEAMFSFTRLISDLPAPPSNARVHTPLGLSSSSSSLLFPWLFEKVTSETKQSSPASRRGPSARRCEPGGDGEGGGRVGSLRRRAAQIRLVGPALSPRRLLLPPSITSSPSSWGKRREQTANGETFEFNPLPLSAASPQPPGKPFSEIKESPSATFSLAGLFKKKKARGFGRRWYLLR